MGGLDLLVQWWDWQEGDGEEKVALHTWGGGAAATRTSLPALRAPHCLLQLRCSLSEGVLLKIKAARAGIAHQEEKKIKVCRAYSSVCVWLSLVFRWFFKISIVLIMGLFCSY